MGRDSEQEVLSVKDFCEAFNLHIRTCNRIWLSLAVLSIAVVPQVLAPQASGSAMLKIPFELGEVPAEQYAYLGLLITIGGLLIYFCQSWAQAMRVHRSAHDFLERLESMPIEEGRNGYQRRIQPPQLYEFFRVSTFTRGGPLLHLLATHKNRVLKASIFYFYFIPLRIITFLVMLGLPSAALGIVYWQSLYVEQQWLVRAGSFVVVLFSSLATATIIFEEARQTLTIRTHFLRSRD